MAFDSSRLGNIPQLLGLLLDNLLILELQKLALLFEIRYNLREGLLEQVNLGFEDFDFFLLFKLAAGVLLRGQAFVLQF